jgi:hypothetical protein
MNDLLIVLREDSRNEFSPKDPRTVASKGTIKGSAPHFRIISRRKAARGRLDTVNISKGLLWLLNRCFKLVAICTSHWRAISDALEIALYIMSGAFSRTSKQRLSLELIQCT